MTGTNPRTVDTPAQAPSFTIDVTVSFAPTAESPFATSAVMPGTCSAPTFHPASPRKCSFAHSVTTPPGTTASQPTTQIAVTKTGSASQRLVTMRSILSESDTLLRRFSLLESALPTSPLMNSYRW